MLKTDIKLLDARIADFLRPSSRMAAGLDLRACWVQPDITKRDIMKLDTHMGISEYIIQPGQKVMIGSGIALDLGGTRYVDGPCSSLVAQEPSMSIAAILLPRSGLGSKLDIRLANTIGLIDADYQGEIIMAVVNGGTEPFPVKPLDRLVQMVVLPVMCPEYNVVDEFKEKTLRGSGGFGSTGKG